MGFAAKINADSVSEEMIRLATMTAQFPRFILPEVLTHRVFSRNTASSRAIPVKKVISTVLSDPAMPVFWGKNRPGMTAGEETNDKLFFDQYEYKLRSVAMQDVIPSKAISMLTEARASFSREEAWLLQRDRAVEVAQAFANAEYHKQIVNRILEPWVHTNMVISSTFWSNFFDLRLDVDAQPEIKVLAEHMFNALTLSRPRLVQYNAWHLPYVKDDEGFRPVQTLRKYSAARIARVSYDNHDGTGPDHDTDLRTFGMLVNGGKLHGSPLEHQATPIRGHKTTNFYGWMQFRELVDKQPKFEIYTGEYHG